MKRDVKRDVTQAAPVLLRCTDVSLLAAMNRELIRDEGHRNPMNLEELEDRMRQWLASGDYRAVAFAINQETLGYALFRCEREHIYLRQFFVRPASRRRGIGRAAFQALMRDEWQGRRVRIEVLIGNGAAIGFWRSLGFNDYCLSMEYEAN